MTEENLERQIQNIKKCDKYFHRRIKARENHPNQSSMHDIISFCVTCVSVYA